MKSVARLVMKNNLLTLRHYSDCCPAPKRSFLLLFFVQLVLLILYLLELRQSGILRIVYTSYSVKSRIHLNRFLLFFLKMSTIWAVLLYFLLVAVIWIFFKLGDFRINKRRISLVWRVLISVLLPLILIIIFLLGLFFIGIILAIIILLFFWILFKRILEY